VAGEGTNDRKVVIDQLKKGETQLHFEMKPGEIVVAARQLAGDERSVALNGLQFPKDTIEKKLRLLVSIAPPAATKKSEWQIHWGAEDPESYVTAGYRSSPDEDEVATPPRCVKVPVKVKGLDVYLIPYRVIGKSIDSLLVMIAPDKDAIRNNMQLVADTNFHWDKPFELVSVGGAPQKPKTEDKTENKAEE
jgi:hypothetical protein